MVEQQEDFWTDQEFREDRRLIRNKIVEKFGVLFPDTCQEIFEFLQVLYSFPSTFPITRFDEYRV